MNGDVVITWLLNAVPDPQTDERLPADVELLGALRRSVHSHGRHLVVLHDCLDEPNDDLTTFARCEPGGNPYWRRWALVGEFLRTRPRITRVWCVDGTDVLMLNDPFPQMAPGGLPDVLYVGSEDKHFGDGSDTDQWLRHHCPAFVEWFDRSEGDQVLNVGLVGGPATFVRQLAKFLAQAERTGDDYEMGAFNAYLRGMLSPPFVTGRPVHTPFLGWVTSDPECWWAHK